MNAGEIMPMPGQRGGFFEGIFSRQESQSRQKPKQEGLFKRARNAVESAVAQHIPGNFQEKMAGMGVNVKKGAQVGTQLAKSMGASMLGLSTVQGMAANILQYGKYKEKTRFALANQLLSRDEDFVWDKISSEYDVRGFVDLSDVALEQNPGVYYYRQLLLNQSGFKYDQSIFKAIDDMFASGNLKTRKIAGITGYDAFQRRAVEIIADEALFNKVNSHLVNKFNYTDFFNNGKINIQVFLSFVQTVMLEVKNVNSDLAVILGNQFTFFVSNIGRDAIKSLNVESVKLGSTRKVTEFSTLLKLVTNGIVAGSTFGGVGSMVNLAVTSGAGVISSLLSAEDKLVAKVYKTLETADPKEVNMLIAKMLKSTSQDFLVGLTIGALSRVLSTQAALATDSVLAKNVVQQLTRWPALGIILLHKIRSLADEDGLKYTSDMSLLQLVINNSQLRAKVMMEIKPLLAGSAIGSSAGAVVQRDILDTDKFESVASAKVSESVSVTEKSLSTVVPVVATAELAETLDKKVRAPRSLHTNITPNEGSVAKPAVPTINQPVVTNPVSKVVNVPAVQEKTSESSELNRPPRTSTQRLAGGRSDQEGKDSDRQESTRRRASRRDDSSTESTTVSTAVTTSSIVKVNIVGGSDKLGTVDTKNILGVNRNIRGLNTKDTESTGDPIYFVDEGATSGIIYTNLGILVGYDVSGDSKIVYSDTAGVMQPAGIIFGGELATGTFEGSKLIVSYQGKTIEVEYNAGRATSVKVDGVETWNPVQGAVKAPVVTAIPIDPDVTPEGSIKVGGRVRVLRNITEADGAGLKKVSLTTMSGIPQEVIFGVDARADIDNLNSPGVVRFNQTNLMIAFAEDADPSKPENTGLIVGLVDGNGEPKYKVRSLISGTPGITYLELVPTSGGETVYAAVQNGSIVTISNGRGDPLFTLADKSVSMLQNIGNQFEEAPSLPELSSALSVDILGTASDISMPDGFIFRDIAGDKFVVDPSGKETLVTPVTIAGQELFVSNDKSIVISKDTGTLNLEIINNIGNFELTLSSNDTLTLNLAVLTDPTSLSENITKITRAGVDFTEQIIGGTKYYINGDSYLKFDPTDNSVVDLPNSVKVIEGNKVQFIDNKLIQGTTVLDDDISDGFSIQNRSGDVLAFDGSFNPNDASANLFNYLISVKTLAGKIFNTISINTLDVPYVVVKADGDENSLLFNKSTQNFAPNGGDSFKTYNQGDNEYLILNKQAYNIQTGELLTVAFINGDSVFVDIENNSIFDDSGKLLGTIDNDNIVAISGENFRYNEASKALEPITGDIPLTEDQPDARDVRQNDRLDQREVLDPAEVKSIKINGIDAKIVGNQLIDADGKVIDANVSDGISLETSSGDTLTFNADLATDTSGADVYTHLESVTTGAKIYNVSDSAIQLPQGYKLMVSEDADTVLGRDFILNSKYKIFDTKTGSYIAAEKLAGALTFASGGKEYLILEGKAYNITTGVEVNVASFEFLEPPRVIIDGRTIINEKGEIIAILNASNEFEFEGVTYRYDDSTATFTSDLTAQPTEASASATETSTSEPTATFTPDPTAQPTKASASATDTPDSTLTPTPGALRLGYDGQYIIEDGKLKDLNGNILDDNISDGITISFGKNGLGNNGPEYTLKFKNNVPTLDSIESITDSEDQIFNRVDFPFMEDDRSIYFLSDSGDLQALHNAYTDFSIGIIDPLYLKLNYNSEKILLMNQDEFNLFVFKYDSESNTIVKTGQTAQFMQNSLELPTILFDNKVYNYETGEVLDEDISDGVTINGQTYLWDGNSLTLQPATEVPSVTPTETIVPLEPSETPNPPTETSTNEPTATFTAQPTEASASATETSTNEPTATFTAQPTEASASATDAPDSALTPEVTSAPTSEAPNEVMQTFTEALDGTSDGKDNDDREIVDLARRYSLLNSGTLLPYEQWLVDNPAILREQIKGIVGNTIEETRENMVFTTSTLDKLQIILNFVEKSGSKESIPSLLSVYGIEIPSDDQTKADQYFELLRNFGGQNVEQLKSQILTLQITTNGTVLTESSADADYYSYNDKIYRINADDNIYIEISESKTIGDKTYYFDRETKSYIYDGEVSEYVETKEDKNYEGYIILKNASGQVDGIIRKYTNAFSQPSISWFDTNLSIQEGSILYMYNKGLNNYLPINLDNPTVDSGSIPENLIKYDSTNNELSLVLGSETIGLKFIEGTRNIDWLKTMSEGGFAPEMYKVVETGTQRGIVFIDREGDNPVLKFVDASGIVQTSGDIISEYKIDRGIRIQRRTGYFLEDYVDWVEGDRGPLGIVARILLPVLGGTSIFGAGVAGFYYLDSKIRRRSNQPNIKVSANINNNNKEFSKKELENALANLNDLTVLDGVNPLTFTTPGSRSDFFSRVGLTGRETKMKSDEIMDLIEKARKKSTSSKKKDGEVKEEV